MLREIILVAILVAPYIWIIWINHKVNENKIRDWKIEKIITKWVEESLVSCDKSKCLLIRKDAVRQGSKQEEVSINWDHYDIFSPKEIIYKGLYDEPTRLKTIPKYYSPAFVPKKK